MPNFIYIMGKSSAGKDTIYKNIKEKINANTYVLYTTRPMRDGEEQGREYNFINKIQFENLKKQDKVIEERNYNVINSKGEKDIWTYTTIADKQWEKQGDFLGIGTLESYISILKYAKEHTEKKLEMIPIYIEIDEQTRRQRAIEREERQKNPNYNEMERRFKADDIDFSKEKLKEAGISEKQTFQNYDIDVCVENIISYINNEKERVEIKNKKINESENDKYER